MSLYTHNVNSKLATENLKTNPGKVIRKSILIYGVNCKPKHRLITHQYIVAVISKYLSQNKTELDPM